MDQKIRQFTDLRVWQQAHELVLNVYRATKGFPREEIFGLTSQRRRAVVSVTSNIAEGFSRQSYREKVQFYSVSAGSLTETYSQLFVARDIGYLSGSDFKQLVVLVEAVHKQLNALIKKSKTIRDV